jgi:hypothetical protein
MVAEMKDTLFFSTLQELNRIKKWAWISDWVVSILRIMSLAAISMGIWSLIQPNRTIDQLIIGLGTVAILMIMSKKVPREIISQENLVLALEIGYQSTKFGVSSLFHSSERFQAEDEWKPYLAREVKRLLSFEKIRFRARASTVLLPAVVAALIFIETKPAIGTALSQVAKSVFNLQVGAELTIVQGGPSNEPTKAIKLTVASPVELDLLEKNLVEIVVLGNKEDPAPIVYLRAPNTGSDIAPADAVFQSFQLTPSRTPGEEEGISRFVQSFSVKDSTDLFISTVSETKPLAHIRVKTLPIPVVSLKVVSESRDPWPDDQPLQLSIRAEGKNPLATVILIIRAGKRESRELVNSVLVENKYLVEADYQLILEPYVESDLAEVEIIAEATDRAIPEALVGRSKPIRINTASAYGRYQQSLATLRELKALIDEGVSERKDKLDPKAEELVQKANVQSQDSPFFDALDRIQIAGFGEKIDGFRNAQEGPRLDDLSNEINDFLFDHEILDDRERDRDFFVAARGISRLLEKNPKDRPTDVATVAEHMTSFLDGREARWKLRVARLGPTQEPKSWGVIASQRPFHAGLATIAVLDREKNSESVPKSLEILSKAVSKFRDWIGELEAAEDKAREQMEQERQQGLASAQDELKELQKAQGQISAKLDRASGRDGAELTDQWPAIRMAQNGNISGTSRLENKLRSLSPPAANRIKAAAESMDKTLKTGNGNDFVQAESQSDLAGRLLRQAESAARESQGRQKSRGRRRRVTGDSYYGQSVVGGDIEIKREYEVDRRYREDILDEVKGARAEGENRAILDNYLRKTVR